VHFGYVQATDGLSLKDDLQRSLYSSFGKQWKYIMQNSGP